MRVFLRRVQAQLMSEFIAYPLEALNETYLNSSHAHVSDRLGFFNLSLTVSDQLHISFESHLSNVINLLGHEVRKNIALFRKPVDKKQWVEQKSSFSWSSLFADGWRVRLKSMLSTTAIEMRSSFLLAWLDPFFTARNFRSKSTRQKSICPHAFLLA